MSVQSMTGFGRSTGETDAWRWVWEARSVNGRGLDIRLRLPQGFDELDQSVRKAIQKRFKRGSVTVSLSATRQSGDVELRLNEAVLRDVLKAADHVQKTTDSTAPSVDGLLALKGVLEVVEQSDSDDVKTAVQQQMLKDLEAALNGMAAVRIAEGERLTHILTEKISEISDLTKKIEAAPSRKPEAIKERLKEQIGRLVETGTNLDDARLHQEAAFLATRADVEEEVKRLMTHVIAAKTLINGKEPIGRQLDFLAQEFNREANTICSKAACNDVSQAGLALKAAIDQMREQVQNIE
ncbi:MAG: YicC family protein [Alphaproteobacteria bacterium]|nr:YicC family protein [Alphaproteobacteria bacterium]